MSRFFMVHCVYTIRHIGAIWCLSLSERVRLLPPGSPRPLNLSNERPQMADCSVRRMIQNFAVVVLLEGKHIRLMQTAVEDDHLGHRVAVIACNVRTKETWNRPPCRRVVVEQVS